MKKTAMVMLVGMLSVTAFSVSASASAWYLMAADEKVVGEPNAAVRMSHGAVAGPFHLTSRGVFASREECESARNKLVDSWSKQSLIKRGSWDKFGLTTPSSFIRCNSATDPHLKKSEGGASMEDYIRGRPRMR